MAVDGCLSFEHFFNFASNRPDLFGDLMRWQKIFARYSEGVGSTGGMRLAGMIELVWDVVNERGDEEAAKATEEWVEHQAIEGMKEMDVNHDQVVSFDEFLRYGRANISMFAGLLGWREVFDRYDSDKSGDLTKAELARCMEDILNASDIPRVRIPTPVQLQAHAERVFAEVKKGGSSNNGGITEFCAHAEKPQSEFGKLLHNSAS